MDHRIIRERASCREEFKSGKGIYSKYLSDYRKCRHQATGRTGYTEWLCEYILYLEEELSAKTATQNPTDISLKLFQ